MVYNFLKDHIKAMIIINKCDTIIFYILEGVLPVMILHSFHI